MTSLVHIQATMAFPRTPLTGHADESEPIDFQILDWYVPEASEWKMERLLKSVGHWVADGSSDGASGGPKKAFQEPKDYEIIMHGATRTGRTVAAKVTGFHPYFYVRIPDCVTRGSSLNGLRAWVKDFQVGLMTRSFFNTKTQRLRTPVPKMFESHMTSVELVKRKDFWGFTNNADFYFLKIKCKSMALFNLLKYFLNTPPDEFIEYYYGGMRRVAAGNGNLKGTALEFYKALPAREKFRLYEANIDPFLRFIHERNLAPCGWARIPAATYDVVAEGAHDDAYCRADITLEVHYKHVQPLDNAFVAPLLIASFDLECTSSHGDFPVPRKDYRKLAQDLIGVARRVAITPDAVSEWMTTAFREPKEWAPNATINKVYPKDMPSAGTLRRILTPMVSRVVDLLEEAKRLAGSGPEDGDDASDDEDKAPKPKASAAARSRVENDLCAFLTTDNKRPRLPVLEGDAIIQIGVTCHRYGSDAIVYRHIITLGTCDPIEGAVVESYASEAQVLHAFKDLMTRLSPDVLIGYNIFGFDMHYLWERAEENGMFPDYLRGWGRLTERPTWCVEQRLSSSALGDNIMHAMDIDGCISIDLLKVMQRDHKLDSYKLDTVAETFLGDRKDDLSPNDIFQKQKGTSADRAVVARYCLQDCALVNRLLHKLKVLENNIGMGNVCSVPLSYLFMRGQGVKIFSLVAKECRAKKLVVPVLRMGGDDPLTLDEDGYEGAIVLPPREGIYLNDAITVFDYSSLYPSSMIERDLSHDRYVDTEWEAEYGNLPGVVYETISYDVFEGKGDAKKVVGQKTCKFAQRPKGEKGILPSILEMLLQQRKNTRKKMEYETLTMADGRQVSGVVSASGDHVWRVLQVDSGAIEEVAKTDVVGRRNTYQPFELDILEATQLAYKVTANSLYGQLGAKTSPIYWKDIAACTTATGRERILFAKGFMEKTYDCEVIYGDTDSIFCMFKHYNACGERIQGKATIAPGIQMGIQAAAEIKKHLPSPQCLAYEKTLWPLVLIARKKYIGGLYEMDANAKPKIKSMGVVLKRRDNAPIVKQVYGGVLDCIMKQDLQGSVTFLESVLRDLVSGKCPLESLVISKSLRGHYKDPDRIAHKVLANRMGERDPGNAPQTNDRIAYVYITPPPGTVVKLQGDRIEHPDYVRANALQPDVVFYITNQIMKPVVQLYALCLEQLPNYPYPPSYWDQIDEELKEKPIYQNDRKRRDRLNTLKERLVEELLFAHHLPAKVKAARASSSTRTAKGKAGNTAMVSQMPMGEIPFLFRMRLKEGDQATTTKSGEPAKRAIKLYLVHMTLEMPSFIPWQYTLSLVKSKTKNKTQACIQGMCKAFRAWMAPTTDGKTPLWQDIKDNGVHLSLPPPLVKALRGAWEMAVKGEESIVAARDAVLNGPDMGIKEGFDAFQDTMLSLELVMSLKDVPFEWAKEAATPTVAAEAEAEA